MNDNLVKVTTDKALKELAVETNYLIRLLAVVETMTEEIGILRERVNVLENREKGRKV